MKSFLFIKYYGTIQFLVSIEYDNFVYPIAESCVLDDTKESSKIWLIMILLWVRTPL